MPGNRSRRSTWRQAAILIGGLTIVSFAVVQGQTQTAVPTIDQAAQSFSSGDYAKGLRQAQGAVQALDAFQKAAPVSDAPPQALTLREDDPKILKSNCLFEQGTFAFLSGQADQAGSYWGLALDALTDVDPAKDFYERRAAVAVAMTQLKKASNFGETFRILETVNHQVRDYPLPREAGLFPNQQRIELLLITSDGLFSAVRDMSAAASDPDAVGKAMGIGGTAMIGDTSLYRLLSSGDTSANVYEQVLDQLLFAAPYQDAASSMVASAADLCRSLPAPAQGAAEALTLLWGTQLPSDQLGRLQATLPGPGTDFGQRLVAVLRLANDSGSEATVKALCPVLKAYEPSLASLSPREKIDLADLLSTRADPDLLLRLLNSATSGPLDPALTNAAQLAKLRVCSDNGRAKDAIAVGEALKSSASPTPEIYYYLGVSYAKAEQPTAATQNLSDFVSKADSNAHLAGALELLGKLYLSQGQKSDALAAFQQLISLFPNSTSAERSRPFVAALASQP